VVSTQSTTRYNIDIFFFFFFFEENRFRTVARAKHASAGSNARG
jgi:hypothetical protein